MIIKKKDREISALAKIIEACPGIYEEREKAIAEKLAAFSRMVNVIDNNINNLNLIISNFQKMFGGHNATFQNKTIP